MKAEAEEWYYKGDEYLKGYVYKKADECFTKAIKLDPKFAKAYYNRGVANTLLGESDLAIVDFTKAVELDPKSTEAYNNRGDAYNDLGKYDLAIAYYTRAIEPDPTDPFFYYNRANFYLRKLGKYDLSMADFNKAIEIDPKYATAYLGRGLLYKQQNDYENPKKGFKQACDLGYLGACTPTPH